LLSRRWWGGGGAKITPSYWSARCPGIFGYWRPRATGVRVYPCPLPVDGFAVRQHWHARYHQEAGNRWLRGVVSQLFGAGH
jgi:hypothetical protein